MSVYIRYVFIHTHSMCGFPGGSVVNNLPAGATGDRRRAFNPWSGRSLGGGNGNPLQYSCLWNPVARGPMGSQRVRHD